MGGRTTKSKLSQNLTEKEIDIINTYVSHSNLISEEDSKVLQGIISNKGNVSGKISLYRQVSIDEIGVNKLRQLRENPESIVGTEVTSKGFLSTAKTESGTLGFLVPKSVTIHFTHSKSSGLDISKISKKSNEQEVLFSKNTKYRITRSKALYDKDGDFMNMEIEAVIL